VKEEFYFVEIIPGSANIFLASNRPLNVSLEEMADRIERLSLENTYIIPQVLFSRLSPQRVEGLRELVSSGTRVINRDLEPISYYFNSVLWSSQFGGLEARVFSGLAGIGSFWYLDAPLVLFLIILILMGLRRKLSYFVLTPVAVMGFTTIVTEILLIIAYQAFNGYLYQSVALLFAAFMLGLSSGAFTGMLKKKVHFVQIILDQAGLILLLAFSFALLRTQPQEILFILILFVLGLLGGDLFVVSNRLYLRTTQNYGLGYGLDLLGSFVGAVAVSSVLIPLVGLLPLIKYLLLMNSFCLLFLIWGATGKKISKI
jgi:spermidine synthase